MAVRRRNAPDALFAAALLAAAVLLVALSWKLTFFQDTWAILMERQGHSAHDFLAPHNEHLVVFQVALEKLLIGLFGMTTARPEYLVMVATLMASASMVYVYIRRRTDPWLALLAALLLLFLGPAWQVQLWPFEIEFVVPLAAGLGALLMLERETRGGDSWACLLMTLALGFGSLGLSFLLAAAVEVFLKRRRRGWARIWIVVLPLVLYAAWYVGWGREAEHHLTLHNVLASPPYLFDGFATAVGSLSGLAPSNVTAAPQSDWGRVLLVALLGLAVYFCWRRPRLPDSFWLIATAAVSFWLFAAFNFIPGREAVSPRYVYAGAAFVLLLAAEVLRGVELSTRARVACAVVVGVALLPNLVQMKEGADFLRAQSVLTRADTGAIEIAARTVDPSFGLSPEIAGTPSLINVNAEGLLKAVSEHGSPGYSPSELVGAPEAGRRQADVVLAHALPLATQSGPNAYRAQGRPGCTDVPAGTEADVPIPPGTIRVELAPGPAVTFHLRRFAVSEYPVDTEAIPGGSMMLVQIPADRAPQPWQLQVAAGQAVRVCPSGG